MANGDGQQRERCSWCGHYVAIGAGITLEIKTTDGRLVYFCEKDIDDHSETFIRHMKQEGRFASQRVV